MMTAFSMVLGSAGVFILLFAFFLNLFGFLNQRTNTYTLMNAVGAGVSCYTSYLIDFMPFVVLEATWMVMALVGFVQVQKKSWSV